MDEESLGYQDEGREDEFDFEFASLVAQDLDE